MDLAQILRQLWRRRVLVLISALVALIIGISVAYTPSLSPAGFHKRALELGTASTTLQIDTKQSAALDIAGSLEPLSSRGQTYATIASSGPVLSDLARRVHVPPSAIVRDTGLVGKGSQQSATQRSNSVATDAPVNRLSVIAVPDQPLLNVATQAPSAEKAIQIANATGQALRDYMVRQQNQQKVPPVRRVIIRQLGAARGGVINSGANPAAAVLGGLATIVALCLLILFSDRLRSDMRRKRVRGAPPSSLPSEGGVRAQGVDSVSDAVADRRRARTGA